MSYKIIGTGSARPALSKSNDDLAEFLDTSDEWISTRTGIKSRHVCTSETISTLAIDAGKAALSSKVRILVRIFMGELLLILVSLFNYGVPLANSQCSITQFFPQCKPFCVNSPSNSRAQRA